MATQRRDSELEDLFGLDSPWHPTDWIATDDRVRGGHSTSHLTCKKTTATFHGHLDIKTLGGAGFASQRTVDPQKWDLSAYDALVLNVDSSDGKKYTVVIKDKILPRRKDGREQSTISWEYDFVPPCDGGKVVMALGDFTPTYRGRAKPDAAPLDLKAVKRISFMMRSFFGEQEGDFELVMKWLAAAKLDDDEDESVFRKTKTLADGTVQDRPPLRSSWLGWFCGLRK